MGATDEALDQISKGILTGRFVLTNTIKICVDQYLIMRRFDRDLGL